MRLAPTSVSFEVLMCMAVQLQCAVCPCHGSVPASTSDMSNDAGVWESRLVAGVPRQLGPERGVVDLHGRVHRLGGGGPGTPEVGHRKGATKGQLEGNTTENLRSGRSPARYGKITQIRRGRGGPQGGGSLDVGNDERDGVPDGRRVAVY